MFGAAAASLVSAVEPAQAFSLYSSSSSYSSSLSSNSFNSSSGLAYSYSPSSLSNPSTTNLLSQAPQLSSGGENWLYAIPLALLIWMIAEGLDTTDDGGKTQLVIGEDPILSPPVIIPDGENGGGDKSPVPVPSPALLPGLLGMGAAAVRKRNRQIQADQA